jgi:hypothetical protein
MLKNIGGNLALDLLSLRLAHATAPARVRSPRIISTIPTHDAPSQFDLLAVASYPKPFRATGKLGVIVELISARLALDFARRPREVVNVADCKPPTKDDALFLAVERRARARFICRGNPKLGHIADLARRVIQEGLHDGDAHHAILRAAQLKPNRVPESVDEKNRVLSHALFCLLLDAHAARLS